MYRDAPGWAAQARGVNLLDLMLTLPALVVAVVLAARGSRRAWVVWLGVLGYVLYNAAIFAFTIAFNRLFPVYVAVFGLAIFDITLVTTTIRRDLPAGDVTTAPRVAARACLMLVAALFVLAWMAEIVPAIDQQHDSEKHH